MHTIEVPAHPSKYLRKKLYLVHNYHTTMTSAQEDFGPN